MRSRWYLAGVALLAVTQSAGAQSVGRMLGDDFKNAGKDVLNVWGSPLDAKPRDWLLTVAAFGAFGATMLVDEPVSDWAIRNDSAAFFRAIKPVRRGGWFFSGKYVVPPVAAAYVAGVAFKNQDARDAVMGCMASWGAQSALRKAAYALIGRARPDTMPDDAQHWTFPGGDWMMRSFPAGHFANAMACATFWNKRFDLGYAEPLIYALAGTVGVGRLADRAHWMSDTMLGGILGYAVGREIAKRSLERERERHPNNAQPFVAPDLGGMTFGIRWSF